MVSTCSLATGVLAVVTVIQIIFSILLGFLIVIVRKETKKRKMNLIHPSIKLAHERRVATVSPPREELIREEKSSLSGSSLVVLPEKDNFAVVFFKDEDHTGEVTPMSLREAGNLDTSAKGVEEVILRHKVISNLKEEYTDPSFKKPSSLVLQRTGSAGPSPRKVSSEITRTSSGSVVRKTSRPSTGTSPFRKSRFSVSSLLNRRSVDLDAEKENLILEGQDQDNNDALPDAEEDCSNETSYCRRIILSDDSTEQPTTREAWPSKDSEC